MSRLLMTACLVSLTLTGCGGNLPPDSTPQMKIAKYAGDVMVGVREVQRMTDTLERTAIITEAQAVAVMAISIRVGQGGLQLASALRVYDAAADLAARKLALAEVNAALDIIDRELKELLAPIDASGQKAKYIDLVTEIVRAAWNVRLLLPPGGPP